MSFPLDATIFHYFSLPAAITLPPLSFDAVTAAADAVFIFFSSLSVDYFRLSLLMFHFAIAAAAFRFDFFFIFASFSPLLMFFRYYLRHDISLMIVSISPPFRLPLPLTMPFRFDGF